MKTTDFEEPVEIIRKGPLSCKISVIEGKVKNLWCCIVILVLIIDVFVVCFSSIGTDIN